MATAADADAGVPPAAPEGCSIGSVVGAVSGVTLATYHWPSTAAAAAAAATRAQLFVVHGAGEHAGRYAALASQLAARGIDVHALDHHGMGRSGGPRMVPQSFDAFVGDYVAFVTATRGGAAAPPPALLLGHSLGGLLALHIATAAGAPPFAGVVFSGPAFRLPPDAPDNVLARFGVRAAAALLPSVGISAIDVTHVSRDANVQRDYAADPLVFHGSLPAAFVRTILDGQQAAAALMPRMRGKRFVVLHGGDDRLCNVAGSRDFVHIAAADASVLTVLPNAGHEVLNETTDGCRARCVDIVINFFEDVLGGGGGGGGGDGGGGDDDDDDGDGSDDDAGDAAAPAAAAE